MLQIPEITGKLFSHFLIFISLFFATQISKNVLAVGGLTLFYTLHGEITTLKKISTTHVIKLGFASNSYPPRALNIQCANKLTRYKYDGMVRSASPIVKVIAYSFCWRERKRKYVFQWQTARSKIKKDVDRRGPRLMPSNCKNLDPPYFSLPTTFKRRNVNHRTNRLCVK